MAKIVLKKDHITFTSGNDICELCKPLTKLGITSFNYVRTFEDGSQINLSNIPSWLEYFYNNEFYHVGEFERHPSNYQFGFALWPHLSGQRIFYDARSYFNIDHGITIIQNWNNYCDFYYFGTTSDNHAIINFYLNNIDLLKRFILYFKDKASFIIKLANKDRIILPDHFEKHELAQVNQQHTRSDYKIEFMKETAIRNFQLTGDLDGEVLTNRQLNCVIYLLEGKTAKEIGRTLGLSYRTVESHLSNLKARFNCSTKSELINKLIKNGLESYKGQHNILI